MHLGIETVTKRERGFVIREERILEERSTISMGSPPLRYYISGMSDIQY